MTRYLRALARALAVATAVVGWLVVVPVVDLARRNDDRADEQGWSTIALLPRTEAA